MDHLMRIFFKEFQLNFKVQQWPSFQWGNSGLRKGQECVFEGADVCVCVIRCNFIVKPNNEQKAFFFPKYLEGSIANVW